MKKLSTILVLAFATLFTLSLNVAAQNINSRSLAIEQSANKPNQKFILQVSVNAEKVFKKYKIRFDKKNSMLIFTGGTTEYDENGQPTYDIIRLKGDEEDPNAKVVIEAEDEDTIVIKFIEVDGGRGTATIAFGKFIPEMK
jgi:hypothetical protein